MTHLRVHPGARPTSGAIELEDAKVMNTPERRRHKVFVTRNTEYHFRDRLCVAVRDRRTGDFLPGHLAVKRQLAGGVHRVANGTLIPKEEDPRPGEALYFVADGLDLVTSPLLRVERPAKDVVRTYRM